MFEQFSSVPLFETISWEKWRQDRLRAMRIAAEGMTRAELEAPGAAERVAAPCRLSPITFDFEGATCSAGTVDVPAGTAAPLGAGPAFYSSLSGAPVLKLTCRLRTRSRAEGDIRSHER